MEGDLCGYLASLFVFVTFYMKGMVPLRLTAIASNIAFIGYAWAEDLKPILILHAALLPLNIIRLAQLRRSLPNVRRSSFNPLSIKTLSAMMQRKFVVAKEVLFRSGG